MKYVHPFTDFGFKKIFGDEQNKDILIAFLNELLPERHQIQTPVKLNIQNLPKSSLKYYRDLYGVMSTAKRDGREEGYQMGFDIGIDEGVKIGLETGLEKGREEGREEGSLEARITAARKLQALGMSADIIAQATGIDIHNL